MAHPVTWASQYIHSSSGAERCAVPAQDYVAALADLLPSNPSIQLAPAAAEHVIRLAREAVSHSAFSAGGQSAVCTVYGLNTGKRACQVTLLCMS